MPEHVHELLDEYAARYARGERPEAREYLARAGAGREELAGLLDEFLARAPAPEPADETVAAMRAWRAGDSPLLELRTQRGLKRDTVVDALIDRLSLDQKKRAKVKRYYHELESGLLEPSRVNRRVWDAIAELLKVQAVDLLAWRPRPVRFEAAYLRAETASEALPSFAPVMASVAPDDYDEIDRLFLESGDNPG